MDLSLIIPSFIAGLFTFLAPCTLPLVPGYLGFISGVSLDDLNNSEKASSTRGKIFFNGILYVIGFSLIFILLGSLFGLGGAALAKYRVWLSRIGGAFVIFFGLYMMNILKLPFLQLLFGERQPNLTNKLKPGKPISSLIFGASFAFGWSPCVGPVLGSILVLASSSATVTQGALLLAVFSSGLAIPFLLIALGISSAGKYISRITRYLNIVSVVGGAFLVFLGLLMLTNNFAAWLSFFYRTFNFLNADSLLNHL